MKQASQVFLEDQKNLLKEEDRTAEETTAQSTNSLVQEINAFSSSSKKIKIHTHTHTNHQHYRDRK